MKTVGIVTLYDDINIGNKLQNYAVQTYFEQMGYICRTIPHWEMVHNKLDFQSIKLTLIKKVGFPRQSAEKLRMYDKRKKRFRQFSDRYLKLAPCVKFNCLPIDFSNQFDYFVTGSDQVWHNWTGSKKEIDYFMLAFAKKNQRLTISPSFGKNSIESVFVQSYKKGLLGFPVITCREEHGAEIIWGLTGQTATVLLDPTMLVNQTEWYKIEKMPAYHPEKYLLVYSLGDYDKEIKNFIINVAKENSLELRDVYNPTSTELFMTTPDEFLYYIHHASLVVTDSFHACVFSILFETNFVVFNRKTASMGNMESRLDTLLRRFGLTDRKFSTTIEPFQTDFSNVAVVLECERKKAESLYNHTFSVLDAMKQEQ